MNLPIIRSKAETLEPIIEIITATGESRTLVRERHPSAKATAGLVAALHSEPKLLVTRISETVLEHAFRLGSAVAYSDLPDHIAAFGALWPSKDPNWLELGTLYVSPEYRGVGVAKIMHEICDELAPQISLFLLTADPAIVAVAIKRGWRLEGNNWNGTGTFPWDEIIGPLWERYPASPLKEPGLLLYRMAIVRKITLWQHESFKE